MKFTRRQFVKGGVSAFTIGFAAPQFLTELAFAQQATVQGWLAELPAWKHPYPVVLTTILAASLLAAVGAVAVRSARPTVGSMWMGLKSPDAAA